MVTLAQGQGRLSELKRELPEQLLAQPSGRDGFAYGEACGTYKGLVLAMDALQVMLDEADKADNAL